MHDRGSHVGGSWKLAMAVAVTAARVVSGEGLEGPTGTGRGWAAWSWQLADVLPQLLSH